MTADPIAAKAEALWAKRPELRPKANFFDEDSSLEVAYCAYLSEWVLRDPANPRDKGPLCREFAHMLIEAACWRALPWAYHREFVDIDGTLKTYVIERPQRFDEGKMIAQAPSLTEALIAACMEAGQ